MASPSLTLPSAARSSLAVVALRRWLWLLALGMALLGAAPPAASAELSEQAARWASESGFSGSMELRRGAQTLARVERLPEGAAAAREGAEPVYWVSNLRQPPCCAWSSGGNSRSAALPEIICRSWRRRR